MCTIVADLAGTSWWATSWLGTDGGMRTVRLHSECKGGRLTTQNPDPETVLSASRIDPSLARTSLIAEIGRSAPLPTNVSPEEALAATMCAFSQRLSKGKAIRMELGLPGSLVPFVTECIAHRDEGAELDNREDFLQRVASHLGMNEDQADEVATVVLGAVQRLLPVEEVDSVLSQLPEDMRDYWQSAAP